MLPPYFYFPFLRNQSFLKSFSAIWHSISAREGGNTVCWKAMVRRTVDDSMTYWFPCQHPLMWQRL